MICNKENNIIEALCSVFFILAIQELCHAIWLVRSGCARYLSREDNIRCPGLVGSTKRSAKKEVRTRKS